MRIKFDNVSYAYEKNKNVLNDINLEFNKNEIVIEKHVSKDKIRAVVKEIYIGDEKLDTESAEYKKYLKSIKRKINRHKIPVFLSKVKRRLLKKKSTWFSSAFIFFCRQQN